MGLEKNLVVQRIAQLQIANGIESIDTNRVAVTIKDTKRPSTFGIHLVKPATLSVESVAQNATRGVPHRNGVAASVEVAFGTCGLYNTGVYRREEVDVGSAHGIDCLNRGNKDCIRHEDCVAMLVISRHPA